MSVPPDRNGGPSVIGGIGKKMLPLLPTVIGGVAGYYSAKQMQDMANKEAARNREFQREMSNTSHQRDVADLMRAGLNPILSAHGGASTPAGSMAQVQESGVSKALASALAVRQAKANIDLTEAQAFRERTSAWDIQSTFPARFGLADAQRLVAEANWEQIRQAMPYFVARAKEEVGLTASSARQARALAILTELERTGKANVAELEKLMGRSSPFVRLIFEAMKAAK